MALDPEGDPAPSRETIDLSYQLKELVDEWVDKGLMFTWPADYEGDFWNAAAVWRRAALAHLREADDAMRRLFAVNKGRDNDALERHWGALTRDLKAAHTSNLNIAEILDTLNSAILGYRESIISLLTGFKGDLARIYAINGELPWNRSSAAEGKVKAFNNAAKNELQSLKYAIAEQTEKLVAEKAKYEEIAIRVRRRIDRIK